MPDINEYSSAMSIDSATGKIMPKHHIGSREQRFKKLHNNVSINSNANAPSGWEDAEGFNDISFSVQSDANTGTFTVTVLWSHDGVNTHGAQTVLSAAVGVWSNARTGQVATGARYYKLIIVNNDTAAHVFNSYAFLKA
jgi:hypothetical protein